MLNCKLVVLGAGSVGKSAIAIQFVNEKFVEKYDPTIEDLYRKVIEINGNYYMLEIMDTAGQETFLVMRDLYIRNGQGFILVYSIASKSTYFELEGIKEQICRIKNADTDKIPMIVLGNKCDLPDKDRQVKSSEGDALVKKWGGDIDFMETSAKSNINISSAFEQIVQQIKQKSPVKNTKKKPQCLII
ncbi:Ras GTPase [Tieghemostelium lacteum]|uniref:small monomeric GTPase n=1 Tax=Tieghemostelium lacteum TaxID=361077 RepID=A0A151ZFV3_TIELA|nr:Ras GTPase [Tieghemostelium lacteum]|eukprot:KYQ92807.1 Ras GTPase [Tieghemostelium lacteum]